MLVSARPQSMAFARIAQGFGGGVNALMALAKKLRAD
jgi:hypothetical protein